MPLMVTAVNVGMWVDTRYMHTQISDGRHIDLQIRILQGNIRDYELMQETRELTPKEKNDLDIEKRQLANLLLRRQDIMGLQ